VVKDGPKRPLAWRTLFRLIWIILLYGRTIGRLRRDDQYVLEALRLQRRSSAVELLPADVGIALHDLGRDMADLGSDGSVRPFLPASLNPDSFAYASVEQMM